MRMISAALRHGADIKFVVEQLQKTHGDMTSMTKSIARALKKYIGDGEKSGENCTECSAKLIYQEGCLKCESCGYAKCG
jgi:ribonucleoside-diphosphate reductase alpha chain